jgi:hypothetical protein
LARVLSTAFVVALVAATAGAFALTEGAKLTRSPIFRTSVAKVFSPDCRCRTSVAPIEFRLRARDRLTIWVTHDGKRVATLVPGRTYPRGRVVVDFDGTSASGPLPDGVYKPVVHLARSHRTIALPNEIRLDTRPPSIHVRHPLRAIISPDGDGRKDAFRVRYSLDEPAQGILTVNGTRVAFTHSRKPEGELVWNGRLGGRPARPRLYVLRAAARDLAGNVSKPFPFAIVQVRYVALGRKRVVVGAGKRFAIRVSTDAPTVRWTLHGRSGLARRGTLLLHAPRSKGVFHLYVSANGHAAQAAVVVA